MTANNDRSAKSGGIKTRGRRGRPPKRIIESESEMEYDDEDEDVEDVEMEDGEDEESREWDDECYICNKGGEVMCCETCCHVSHFQCLGLKKMPDDWYCEDCLK